MTQQIHPFVSLMCSYYPETYKGSMTKEERLAFFENQPPLSFVIVQGNREDEFLFCAKTLEGSVEEKKFIWLKDKKVVSFKNLQDHEHPINTTDRVRAFVEDIFAHIRWAD